MRIVICEDDIKQRRKLQNLIIQNSFTNDWDTQIVLCAESPQQVLSYIEHKKVDCYFLDIELNSAQNGLELAQEIRNKDSLANIIFVTTYADRLKLTFTYKIAALDYIVKDDKNFDQSVVSSLNAAYKSFKNIYEQKKEQYFSFKVGEFLRKIYFGDIYYFETSTNAHKVILKEENGIYEFYGKLKEIEENLDERFFRCHRSYLINKDKIEVFDAKSKQVKLNDGSLCEVSYKKKRLLQQLYLEAK